MLPREAGSLKGAMSPLLLFTLLAALCGVVTCHECVHNNKIAPALEERSKVYQEQADKFFDVLSGDVGAGRGTGGKSDKVTATSRRLQQHSSARPFKVHFDYQIDGLAADKQAFLQSKLLPTAEQVLQASLAAKQPVTGRLLIPRHCKALWDAPPYLCYKVTDVGQCLDATHNTTYFGAYKECETHEVESCTTYEAGAGVEDQDIILYVTAQNTASCGQMTIAYAGWCEMDAYTKRPIAGNINFCPNMLKTADADFGEMLDTSVHEILHVLAFSDGLYQHFISAEGATMGYANVISDDGAGRKAVKTPKVVEAARNQFGCDSLTSVRLEDQGGSSTAHSHWEELHYKDEIMVGVQSGRGSLSALSLAMLEDSGWYVASFSPHSLTSTMLSQTIEAPQETPLQL